VNGFGHWIASWIAAPGVDPSTFTPYNKTGVDPAAWKMSIPCRPEDVAWSRELQSMTHLRPRRVFFSFNYQRDIWRINQIRNLHEIVGCAAAGFQDASLWEEAKKKGDAEIKKLIDAALERTTVTVVFIGAETAGRKYINYEIQQSMARGNGLVGIQIHNLKGKDGKPDSPGATPAVLTKYGVPVYNYVYSDKLAFRIEEAAKRAGK
jgi:MTH538 TIR-like domain (DUF1863)